VKIMMQIILEIGDLDELFQEKNHIS